jgi:hypothetical protein
MVVILPMIPLHFPSVHFLKASFFRDLRKLNLLRHIREVEADVLCLEEIDHFDDFFEPSLAKVPIFQFYAIFTLVCSRMGTPDSFFQNILLLVCRFEKVDSFHQS